ncbi:Uncharacterised protein [Candidatus Venteria ishoeyi]|uniref:Phosphoadenosine phosphosulphate reductase domain-containing protein n=1 Tax=Candidatus Venteria ishoeyi TaxID=1899563 RepID=A0A1H6F7J0_9GAMM|nr:Uncharacterised protein [Candidatus Venteria ishoeyi]
MWIGFSVDERNRCKAQSKDDKWLEWYPLIEMGLQRLDSITYVKKMGWPEPPRSACWMCPNHSDFEWLRLKEDGEINRAVALEQSINAQRTEKGEPELFFHRSCQPIGSIDFEDTQVDMFDTRQQTCQGGCFV